MADSFNDKHIVLIAQELDISVKQVGSTVKLLEEGATIPFISRYRKEQTGSLDEVEVTNIRDRLGKLVELQKRKETILKTIDEQGKLTSELRNRIEECFDAVELEDIYLPYKPKRRTRATIAKERGLEPLAHTIFSQAARDVADAAQPFVSDEVPTANDAIAGARDIIAEWISESQRARNIVRKHFRKSATISSKLVKGKEEEGAKYSDYFDWNEHIKRCASHRFLAMRRGQTEGFLKVSIAPPADDVLDDLSQAFVKYDNESADHVDLAIEDSYKRLIEPSIENEFTSALKESADLEAIKVFSDNLRQLLLASPLGQKNVLALDPGYRSGCKLVCLDSQGNLKHNETIYPHQPQNEQSKAMSKISALVDTYKIEAIAIGNGTASRETESLVKRIRFNKDVNVYMVSEDGASIYSASSVAREEFPEYDVTVRGAVSIGRRLMDPLAELVKIDPKSIGVGQYQHDVDQGKLRHGLDTVVESCVNHVGVNLNTASKHLLTYISGLGPQLAKNIVEHRRKNGDFTSRSQIKKVPRLGAKAFEQCAGFMRIVNADNPLDNSAVHPESYHVVEQMAHDLDCTVNDLLTDEAKRKRIDINRYVTSKIGLPTLKDIVEELAKPGRDPRQGIKVFEFAEGIYSIEQLFSGMVIPGIITNITNFGAFVDIGVKQDGLVHISQMADRFISNPNDVVKLHQHVKVKVLEVDVNRKRIQLSMKGLE